MFCHKLLYKPAKFCYFKLESRDSLQKIKLYWPSVIQESTPYMGKKKSNALGSLGNYVLFCVNLHLSSCIYRITFNHIYFLMTEVPPLLPDFNELQVQLSSHWKSKKRRTRLQNSVNKWETANIGIHASQQKWVETPFQFHNIEVCLKR